MSVKITAPDSAEQGHYVRVSVEVINILGPAVTFRTRMFAGPNQIFSTEETLGYGPRTYSSGFTMPASSITVHAYVEAELPFGGGWRYYGEDSKLVSLGVAPPPPPPDCSISITTFTEAEEGETVGVIARITNNSPDRQMYQVGIYADDALISIPLLSVAGGSSEPTEASFIMPGADATVLVWVDVWYDEQWQYSNSASKVVALYVPPPPLPESEFRGFSVREYNRV